MGTCPSGEAAASIVIATFAILNDHLTAPQPSPAYRNQRIYETFPTIHRYNGTLVEPSDNTSAAQTDQDPVTKDPIISIVVGVIRSFITDVVGIDTHQVVGFFTGGMDTLDDTITFAKVAKSALSCDFKSVIDCSGKRVDPITGAFAVCFVLACLYASFGSLGAFILGWLAVFPLVMWYVYGYSPLCIPMIPECTLVDILNVAATFVPLQLTWPARLQKIPGCALNESVPYQVWTVVFACLSCVLEFFMCFEQWTESDI